MPVYDFSSGFNLLNQGINTLGEALGKQSDYAAMRAIGDQLNQGNYKGAVAAAFAAGQPQVGLKLQEMVYGQQIGQQAQADYDRAFGPGAQQGGTSSAQPGPSSATGPGTPSAAGISTSGPTTIGGEGGINMAALKQAIAGNESAGYRNPYGAVGPETGKGRAIGKYQVMPFNVGPWTQQYIGHAMTPEQFAADPAAQERVFEGYMTDMVGKYGFDGAVNMWFTGKPNPPPTASDRHMTAPAYLAAAQRNYARYAGGAPTPQSSGGGYTGNTAAGGDVGGEFANYGGGPAGGTQTTGRAVDQPEQPAEFSNYGGGPGAPSKSQPAQAAAPTGGFDYANINPKFAGNIQGMLADLNKQFAGQGIEWRPISGYRSIEEQQKLYDAYQHGSDIKAARPGTSWHNYGGAIDIMPFRNGVQLGNDEAIPLLQRIGPTASRYGVTWRGDPKDLAHFQAGTDLGAFRRGGQRAEADVPRGGEVSGSFLPPGVSQQDLANSIAQQQQAGPVQRALEQRRQITDPGAVGEQPQGPSPVPAGLATADALARRRAEIAAAQGAALRDARAPAVDPSVMAQPGGASPIPPGVARPAPTPIPPDVAQPPGPSPTPYPTPTPTPPVQPGGARPTGQGLETSRYGAQGPRTNFVGPVQGPDLPPRGPVQGPQLPVQGPPMPQQGPPAGPVQGPPMPVQGPPMPGPQQGPAMPPAMILDAVRQRQITADQVMANWDKLGLPQPGTQLGVPFYRQLLMVQQQAGGPGGQIPGAPQVPVTPLEQAPIPPQRPPGFGVAPIPPRRPSNIGDQEGGGGSTAIQPGYPTDRGPPRAPAAAPSEIARGDTWGGGDTRGGGESGGGYTGGPDIPQGRPAAFTPPAVHQPAEPPAQLQPRSSASSPAAAPPYRMSDADEQKYGTAFAGRPPIPTAAGPQAGARPASLPPAAQAPPVVQQPTQQVLGPAGQQPGGTLQPQGAPPPVMQQPSQQMLPPQGGGPFAGGRGPLGPLGQILGAPFRAVGAIGNALTGGGQAAPPPGYAPQPQVAAAGGGVPIPPGSIPPSPAPAGGAQPAAGAGGPQQPGQAAQAAPVTATPEQAASAANRVIQAPTMSDQQKMEILYRLATKYAAMPGGEHVAQVFRDRADKIQATLTPTEKQKDYRIYQEQGGKLSFQDWSLSPESQKITETGQSHGAEEQMKGLGESFRAINAPNGSKAAIDNIVQMQQHLPEALQGYGGAQGTMFKVAQLLAPFDPRIAALVGHSQEFNDLKTQEQAQLAGLLFPKLNRNEWNALQSGSFGLDQQGWVVWDMLENARKRAEQQIDMHNSVAQRVAKGYPQYAGNAETMWGVSKDDLPKAPERPDWLKPPPPRQAGGSTPKPGTTPTGKPGSSAQSPITVTDPSQLDKLTPGTWVVRPGFEPTQIPGAQ